MPLRAPPTACADRAEAPRHRRAPPSHGDVLGPRRFDGTLGAHGPGGPARGHFRLSEVRRRDCAALRRVRSEVHGRRRAGVLRLSAGPRGRRRAGGTGGAGVDRSGRRVEVQCSTANPRRHCHRVGRGRRSDRIGCGSGAAALSARRRTLRHVCKALPSRTRSSSPRARESCSAICSSLQDLGAQGPQGHRRAGAGLGGAATKLRWKAASRLCTRAA